VIARVLAVALLLAPAAAEACASCISSAYGDRTYSWPYVFLILVPFAVGVAVGAVLIHVGGGFRALRVRERLAQFFHPAARQEETS
jgi:MFS family permease